jgi:Domain of unknown function (DUF4838)
MSSGPDGAFARRGIVLSPGELADPAWVPRMAAAGLNVVALHADVEMTLTYVASAAGQAFLRSAREAGLEVEYELHALSWLLPRDRFAAHPDWFRMDRHGARRPDANLCPSHPEALAIAAARARELAERLRPTTERFYFWADDGGLWCHCDACRGLSDADQNVTVMNALLAGVRERLPAARLACLAYLNALAPPERVRPVAGLFLEYAPIGRCFRHALADPDCALNRPLLAGLPALLQAFGTDGAQVLEYWLDSSLFSGWKRPAAGVPFARAVLTADLATYARLGFRSVTTFGVYLDPEYVSRYGEPPVREYGECLQRCFT